MGPISSQVPSNGDSAGPGTIKLLVYSKWIKDLNVRPGTIKLLNENIGRTLFDINHSKIFLDPLPRVMKMKAKINKWDLIKLKSFCREKKPHTHRKDNPQVPASTPLWNLS